MINEIVEIFGSLEYEIISGEWREANKTFEKTKKMLSVYNYTDGPSEVLQEFMGSHRFKAPSDWKGFRKLTAK